MGVWGPDRYTPEDAERLVEGSANGTSGMSKWLGKGREMLCGFWGTEGSFIINTNA